jgi:CO/xanthine dehydrogenase Mo-binding subunit
MNAIREGESETVVVGKSCQRVDGIAKVTGKALFAADINVKGALYCQALRSTKPHAVLKKIETAAALAVPGVVGVFTASDIPGENRFGIILRDEPILVEDRVRKVGDSLAVVTGETREAVKKALALIKVDCDELPALFSPDEAMAEGAPIIHGKSNILSTTVIKRGDADAAFADAAIVVTRRYTTQRIEHAYIEPEAGVATYENGCINLWVSTQNPHYDRREIARMLGLGQHRVRVIQAVTGGGFGGKLDLSVQCLLALAAYKTGRPVRMVYDREESIITSTKRHPFTIDYTSACDKEGHLLAVKAKIVGDTGAYASYGPGVLKRAAVHATGPYNVASVNIESLCVYTNNPTSSSMRGFGVTQLAFAHESQMDIMAEAVGIDPFEIRLRNCYRKGSLTATGQKLTQSVGIAETIERARSYARGLGMGDVRKKNSGIGVGCMWYGIGSTGTANPSGAFVDYIEDATAIVLTGCAEIGQGSSTMLQQIAAEELGLAMEDVMVMAGDTGISPEAGTTSASRQTYVSGNAVRIAAREAKLMILKEAGETLGVDPAELNVKEGWLWRAGEKTSLDIKSLLTRCRVKGTLTLGSGWFNPEITVLDENGQGIPYATYSYATQVAEVRVSPETGMVNVSRIVAANDVGKAINPQSVEGQMEGGCLMGMGYALLEEVKMKDGHIENPSFSEYLLPMSLDVPEIYPIIVEDHEITGPYGAKGVGEPALIPTVPAIANALNDALGIRLYDLPFSPEKVVEALK